MNNGGLHSFKISSWWRLYAMKISVWVPIIKDDLSVYSSFQLPSVCRSISCPSNLYILNWYRNKTRSQIIIQFDNHKKSIARFMCSSKPEAGLYGSSVHETAIIDEAIERHLFSLNRVIFKEIISALGHAPIKEEEHKELNKKMKDYFIMLNDLLKDKEYLALDRLTLADVYAVMAINVLMATVIDAEFRETVPNLIAWYERVRKNKTIMSHLGTPRYIGTAVEYKICE